MTKHEDKTDRDGSKGKGGYDHGKTRDIHDTGKGDGRHGDGGKDGE